MGKSRLAALFLLFITAPAGAQITVSSLTEMQRGEVPSADSTALSTVYEQFNVDYSDKGLQAGLRAEVYNAWGADRQTVHLTQKYLRWTHGSAYLVAGNYYAMLGRGLTLRAFELPGVVLESQAYRLRYTPSQDLEGGLASWTGDRIELKALIGRPVKSDIPPGAKGGTPPETIERREEWITGGEISVRPFLPVKIGGTAVRRNPVDQDSSWVWSALNEIDLTPLLEKAGLKGIYSGFYGEYARRIGNNEGHALYLLGNIGGSRLGLGIEYKDYDNFILKFNDPPSLVREHTAFLLNRSTHVLLPLNERGYQIEATYALPGLATFTANVSQASNDLAKSFNFEERYLAIDLEEFLPLFSGTAFYNWGKDDLNGISRRRTGGLLLETSVWKDQTLGLDLQAQRVSQPFGPVNFDEPFSFTETYAAFSYQHPLGFGATLAMDRSADPADNDRAGTGTWWSLSLNARFGGRYNAVLFAGERRGGTACTSGTCYQVLPFKGLEMRLNTYF